MNASARSGSTSFHHTPSRFSQLATMTASATPKTCPTLAGVTPLPTATGSDRAFYQGKVAAARFFASNVLPPLAAQRAIAESIDNSLMDLAEDAF